MANAEEIGLRGVSLRYLGELGGIDPDGEWPATATLTWRFGPGDPGLATTEVRVDFRDADDAVAISGLGGTVGGVRDGDADLVHRPGRGAAYGRDGRWWPCDGADAYSTLARRAVRGGPAGAAGLARRPGRRGAGLGRGAGRGARRRPGHLRQRRGGDGHRRRHRVERRARPRLPQPRPDPRAATGRGTGGRQPRSGARGAGRDLQRAAGVALGGVRRLHRAAGRAAAVDHHGQPRSCGRCDGRARRARSRTTRTSTRSRSTSARRTRHPGSPAGCSRERAGEDALLRFYRQADGSEEFAGLFRRSFGVTEREFTEQWRAALSDLALSESAG